MTFFIMFISALLPYSISLRIDDPNGKLISTKSVEVAALGRVAHLGDLYDARTDKFVGISLYNEDISKDAIHKVDTAFLDIDYVRSESISEKFEKLGVSASLSMSVLGGLIKVSGSGKYLNEDKESSKSAKASLVYKIRTVEEHLKVLSFKSEEIIDCFLLENIDATHVVVGIEWGANVVLSVEESNTDSSNFKQIQGKLEAALKTFGFSAKADKDEYNGSTIEMSKTFTLRFNGDIVPNAVPQSMRQAMNFTKNVLNLVKYNNEGKGKMMKYILMPLETIRKVPHFKNRPVNSIISEQEQFNSSLTLVVKDMNKGFVDQFMYIFQEMKNSQLQVNDVYNDMAKWTLMISEKDFKEVSEFKRQFDSFTNDLKVQFAGMTVQFRSGGVDEAELNKMIDDYKESKWTSASIYKFLRTYRPTLHKIKLLNLFESFNAMFVDRRADHDIILTNNFMDEVRIISIDLGIDRLISSFYVREIIRLLQDEVGKGSRGIKYYIEDKPSLTVPHINVYTEGNVISSFPVRKREYVVLISERGNVIIMDANSYEQTATFFDEKLKKKSFAVLDDELYIIDSKTGLIEATSIKNIIEKRRGSSIRWTLVGSFPNENDNAQSVAAVNGSAFYFITYDGLLYKYDKEIKTVAKCGHLSPGNSIHHYSSIVVNGVLYICRHNTFYAFDGTGLGKLRGGTDKSYPGLFEKKGWVCSVGGEINFSEYGYVHCYDTEKRLWLTVSFTNEVRRYPAVVKTMSKTMMFGGVRIGADGLEIGTMDSAEVFDSWTETWSYIPTPPAMLADIYLAFSVIL